MSKKIGEEMENQEKLEEMKDVKVEKKDEKLDAEKVQEIVKKAKAKGKITYEVLRRALDTLGMILERETEDVLIVTHSGVLMALRCYIAGQAFEEMGIIRYKTKNAEVVEIFADDVKDAIERFQKGE